MSELLYLPLKWHKPQTIFVNSMSDLFHEDVPDDFIITLFNIMNQANWHRFQILTKRSERLLKLSPKLNWAANIWMGVSVEDSEHEYRVSHLIQTGAEVKFISFEPLLGLIEDVDLDGIDWVIAGGESGPYARPMEVSMGHFYKRPMPRTYSAFLFQTMGWCAEKNSG